MIDFSGQVVLVTGGGAGIGRATVSAFVDCGATVVVLEIDAARAAELRQAYEQRVLVVEGDASDPADVTTLAEVIGERYGRLNVLVNNVGHVVTRPMRFESLRDDQIDDIYRLNLKHIFLVTRTMLPLLRTADAPSSIVNVSSVEAMRGIPGFSVYGAFKTAITGFTMSLALELGPEGIRVNAVAPETTDSAHVVLDDMIHPSQRHNIPRWIPLRRFGTPEDIAGCVLFLVGWYRDDRGKWTNMPVIKGNSSRPAE
ncbi:SDR family NAD(P)-dependent oxidoreductase [Mycolicibacterium sp. 120270]|uniref:SDR family NAD(P)-dependent oxidoreductase n=1 Tax=Mycolicibacterium sp. 120270 TaxID=3090600 RepID=UPI00299F44AA|nr:SDR family NAD(P)-dependent oxidoreductase [Mycolicibacterium sp. 120270]MDX1886616.1 SDR family NAD(P)-dependent oxidoreductase [Mycolicibacterium sp. 120270]